MTGTAAKFAIALALAAIGRAEAQLAPQPTTHDAAACATADDRDVCYLQVVSRASIVPLRVSGDYAGRDDLLRQIEGANGENIQPAPARDAYTMASTEPFLAIMNATRIALERDVAGATPAEAIKPIADSAKNLAPRSFAFGQISTESGAELRIGAYTDIFMRYRAFGPAYEGHPKPSRALTAEALARWEQEVAQPFRASGQFNLQDSREALALAYAHLGDLAGATRVIDLEGPPNAERQYRVAMLAKDHAEALRLAKAELTAPGANRFQLFQSRLSPLLSGAIERSDAAVVEDILRFTFAMEREKPLPEVLIWVGPITPASLRGELVSLIEAQLADPPEEAAILADRRRANLELMLARFAMERGDTQTVDGMITDAQQRLSGCPPTDCNPAELFDLLLVRGRMTDAPGLLEGQMWERLDNSPTLLFDFEVRQGKGVPTTMDWFVERSLHPQRVALGLLSLQTCARERAMPRGMIYQGRQVDFDAALACARQAIALSRTPASIAATAARLVDFPSSMTPTGRPSAANMAIDLAATTLKERPDISLEMEQAALDLWGEGPAVAMDTMALFAMRRLAEARLRAVGRL